MTVWSEFEETAPDGSTTVCRIGRCFIPVTNNQEGPTSQQEINIGAITLPVAMRLS